MTVPEAVQVTFTVGSVEDAERLSSLLVSSRLAACVQVVGPITSTYRWKGEVERSTEWLLLAKSTERRARAVVAAIVDAHPYDVPEVIVTPVVGGHADYLAWVAAEVSGTEGA